MTDLAGVSSPQLQGECPADDIMSIEDDSRSLCVAAWRQPHVWCHPRDKRVCHLSDVEGVAERRRCPGATEERLWHSEIRFSFMEKKIKVTDVI